MNPKPKTKTMDTPLQPLFSKTSPSAMMDQFIKVQEQRDTIHHQRTLEIVDKLTSTVIESQKAAITLLHASMRTLTTTLVALSNPPVRSPEALEGYFDDVVNPMVEKIGFYQEFAPPGCEEGFLSPLNGLQSLDTPDTK